jgi:alpha-N-acetylglucosaminidase
MKGELSHANRIPFLPAGVNGSVVGEGATPEGIFQNTNYYEFVFESGFRTASVPNIVDHQILRAHRRYGLKQPVAPVSTAWALLVDSTYSQDLSVQDSTGIPHFPGSASQFESDRVTPTQTLCLTWQAWEQLQQASAYIDTSLETYRYDLVNVGRELLAQLATPVSQNFSDAISANPMNAALVQQTGSLYVQLLNDVDTLVGTDYAFLIGPWLQSARNWGNGTDCVITTADQPIDCPDFMEWNARSQLTTWNPTPKGATQIPGGPIDYASKHWSGLIRDYYGARAQGILQIALNNATAGKPLDRTAVQTFEATLAYTWQNAYPSTYPTQPVGDYLQVSATMLAEYAPFYSACDQ